MAKTTKTAKKRKRPSDFRINDVGSALDIILAGHNMVVGRDFILKRNDPYNADIGHLDPQDLKTYDHEFVTDLINFKVKGNARIPDNLENLYMKYKKHRAKLSNYQEKFSKVLYDNEIESAKELGNYDNYISKIVLRNEAETNIFFDYITLYRNINGKRAINQWYLDNPKLLNTKNKEIAVAYSSAQFSILRLDQNLEHGGIMATNIITGHEYLLMDKALNESRMEGCFFICSLLDMKNYVMTSGCGIPINATSDAGKSALTLIKKHLPELQLSNSVFNDDLAECVREVYGFCLRSGIMKNMTIR